MKAIVLEEPGKFARVETAEPGRPGQGEALVRVHRVGICGTDFSGFHGKMPLMSYPRILGHELGVEVLEVGPGVGNVKPGDRCSVEPYINCQNCFACRRNRGNCCESLKVLGVHMDGGMRSKFVLPARKLHKATKLTPDQLALVETLAIGCHAVSRGDPQSGDDVLIIGGGPIGLSVLEFAKIAGARVTVLDVNPKRLEFCKTKGAAVAERIDAQFGLVIDATGSAQSMSSALKYVAHSGRLVYVGITSGDIAFGHPIMHKREMTLMGSRNALPGDFDRIIGLIENGKLDTGPWITHRSPFDRLIEDFPAYTKPETGVIKAIVEIE